MKLCSLAHFSFLALIVCLGACQSNNGRLAATDAGYSPTGRLPAIGEGGSRTGGGKVTRKSEPAPESTSGGQIETRSTLNESSDGGTSGSESTTKAGMTENSSSESSAARTRGQPKPQPEATGSGWSKKDTQECVQKLMTDLFKKSILLDNCLINLEPLTNLTGESININQIGVYIKIRLKQSGKYRVVDGASKEVGAAGPDYQLKGTLEKGSAARYTMTLQILKISDGAQVWSHKVSVK
jgi:hypothetical protein